MACRAALQSLSRRSAVLEQPLRLRIVEGHVEPPAACEPGLAMTTTAEELRVVARRTLGFATPGISRVSLHEVRGMEAARAFTGVTARAELLLVTSRARHR
jgi:hypothetical protein